MSFSRITKSNVSTVSLYSFPSQKRMQFSWVLLHCLTEFSGLSQHTSTTMEHLTQLGKIIVY